MYIVFITLHVCEVIKIFVTCTCIYVNNNTCTCTLNMGNTICKSITGYITCTGTYKDKLSKINQLLYLFYTYDVRL